MANAPVKGSPCGRDVAKQRPHPGRLTEAVYGYQYKYIGPDKRSLALGFLSNVGQVAGALVLRLENHLAGG